MSTRDLQWPLLGNDIQLQLFIPLSFQFLINQWVLIINKHVLPLIYAPIRNDLAYNGNQIRGNQSMGSHIITAASDQLCVKTDKPGTAMSTARIILLIKP